MYIYSNSNYSSLYYVPPPPLLYLLYESPSPSTILPAEKIKRREKRSVLTTYVLLTGKERKATRENQSIHQYLPTLECTIYPHPAPSRFSKKERERETHNQKSKDKITF